MRATGKTAPFCQQWLQVSSRAHPRFARNPGTGEPLATAIRLVAADQAVYHDPEHPSSVVLSVLD